MSDGQVPARTRREFPGLNDHEHYSEGVDVGYRWYFDHRTRAQFNFGFGRSYTSFHYSKLALSGSSGTSRQRL